MKIVTQETLDEDDRTPPQRLFGDIVEPRRDFINENALDQRERAGRSQFGCIVGLSLGDTSYQRIWGNEMMLRYRLAAAATVVMALTAPALAKPSCVKAGGTATSPTVDIATFMAKAALKNSIEAQGLKQKGPETVKCDGNLIGPTCVAHAKACK